MRLRRFCDVDASDVPQSVAILLKETLKMEWNNNVLNRILIECGKLPRTKSHFLRLLLLLREIYVSHEEVLAYTCRAHKFSGNGMGKRNLATATGRVTMELDYGIMQSERVW